MTKPDRWANVIAAIASAWPPERFRDVGVVVGCSGGADSVALLRAMDQLIKSAASPRGFLVVTHFNHRLRGEAADRDVRFVESLAGELGWPFEVERGDGDRSDEQSLRNERLAFFECVLRRRGARYLALAHSQDDNVETVLHRLMRGTGPKGLAGIEPFRPLFAAPPADDFVVARPMLGLGRQQIRDALASRGYPWREDASNQSEQYRRNWIRHRLIPLIESQYPAASQAVARAVEGQRQWSATIDRLAEAWLQRATLNDRPLVLRRLGPAEFPAAPYVSFGHLERRAIVTEAMRQCWLRRDWPLGSMGQPQWTQLCDALCGDSDASMTLPGAVQVQCEGDRVTITREHR
jgi:tRNA(Ile)-lysidine synthase